MKRSLSYNLKIAARYDRPARKVTTNFKAGELACKDGTGYVTGLVKYGQPEINPVTKKLYYRRVNVWTAIRRRKQLCRRLEAVRRDLGRPLTLTSVYRTPAHNAKVEGAPASAHVGGYAADIPATATSVDHLAAVARKHFSGGVGRYYTQDFVHADFKPSEKGQTWVG